MPDNNWNADDTARFLAWGDVALNARDLWRQARYEKYDIDPEDKKTKKRWADGEFTDTERAIFEDSDNLYWKALNDLPGIIYSHQWTVTGRKKGTAGRKTIPLIFFQSAAIDPIGEDGGEAHPTIEVEGHRRAAIFTAGYDGEIWVGLRFNATEVRASVSTPPSLGNDYSPLPKRRFSEAAVRKWYINRVENWPVDETPPSREEDVAAAKSEFEGVTHSCIRKQRNKYAPPSWTAQGKRKLDGK